MRREIRYPAGQVDSLQYLARLDLRRGNRTSAIRRLDEALSIADAHGLAAADALLAVEGVEIANRDPVEALTAFDRSGHLLDAVDRLHVLVRLAKALDRDDLRAAARVLSDRLIANATPSRRAGMIERVTDHRRARVA